MVIFLNLCICVSCHFQYLWPYLSHYFSCIFSSSTNSLTIILVLHPLLPYNWAKLTSAPCVIVYSPGATSVKTVVLNLFSLLVLKTMPSLLSFLFFFFFLFLFWLYRKAPLCPLLHAYRGLWVSGLFWLWCLHEQTNAGQGQLCTHPGKSWYRGESSLGQPLRITLPCLMYMKQNSCTSC